MKPQKELKKPRSPSYCAYAPGAQLVHEEDPAKVRKGLWALTWGMGTSHVHEAWDVMMHADSEAASFFVALLP